MGVVAIVIRPRARKAGGGVAVAAAMRAALKHVRRERRVLQGRALRDVDDLASGCGCSVKPVAQRDLP